MAQAPFKAALLRYGWQHAGRLERFLGRTELGNRLTPQEQLQLQQLMAALNARPYGLKAQQQGLLQCARA